MASLNFYISIFNFYLNSKKYTLLFLSLVILSFVFSFVLNRLNLNITDNDIIKNYQLNKIESINFMDINTIIVGDSSGGNSMDAQYFTLLSGLQSENLCLTGSWGIVGSLGIIKKALHKNQNIKNIVIIHTLDIWGRDFPKESILELYDFNFIIHYLDTDSIFAYFFNLKEIWWHLKYLIMKILNHSTMTKIDTKNDYILQRDNKFSNGKSTPSAKVNFDTFSDAKKMELVMLDRFCRDQSLNCIFLNGPIHSDLVKDSDKIGNFLNSDIKQTFDNIKYYPTLFSYPAYKIGDSIDHIDTAYKKESTLNYYNLIKNDLVK